MAMNWKAIAIAIIIAIAGMFLPFLIPGFMAVLIAKVNDYKDGAILGGVTGLILGLIIGILTFVGSTLLGSVFGGLGGIIGGAIGVIAIIGAVILGFVLGAIGGLIAAVVAKNK